MTTIERKIAYIAVMPRGGMDGGQLEADIAQEVKRLGISLAPNKLAEMLDELTKRNIVTMRVTEARNVNSAEPPRSVSGWYEKGMDWSASMGIDDIIEELKKRKQAG